MKLFRFAQISIFISLFFFLLISFIFILSTSDGDRTNLLKNSRIDSESSFNLDSFKESIDFCLRRSTNKALVLGGFKGGYLFEKEPQNNNSFEKYYSSQGVFTGLLSADYLNFLDLTAPIYLTEENIFVFSKANSLRGSENPRKFGFSINDEEILHSYKEDFELFTLSNFIDCIDLTEFENAGYDVDIFKRNYFFKKIDDKNFILRDLKAEIGDVVYFTYGNQRVKGNVTDILNNGIDYLVSFDEGLFLPKGTEFKTLRVVNPKNEVNLFFDFDRNSVNVNLDFPILLKNSGKDFSIYNSKYLLEIPYINSFLILDRIIREKSMNRSLEWENSSVLENYLAGLDSVEGLRVKFFNLIERDDYVRTLVSILNNDSIINGAKIYYNGIYENTAPELNLSINERDFTFFNPVTNSYEEVSKSFSCNKFNQEEKKCLIYSDVNLNRQFFLRPNIINQEIIDFDKISFKMNLGNGFVFDGPYYSASITPNGVLEFMARREGVYSIPVVVTDGELSTEYSFVFVSGIPKNENNKDSKDCFNIFPEENLHPTLGIYYPIDSYFIEENNNNAFKMFDGSDENGDELPFTYILRQPKDAFDYFSGTPYFTNPYLKYYLKASEFCFDSPEQFGIIWRFYDVNGNRISNYELSGDLSEEFPLENILTKSEFDQIFNSGNPVLVEGSLVDDPINPISGNEILDNKFKFLIYPSFCMTPSRRDLAERVGLSVSTGETLSCCDTESLILHSENSGTPLQRGPSFLSQGSQLKQGVRALDQKMYFTVPFSNSALLNNQYVDESFPFESSSIWNESQKFPFFDIGESGLTSIFSSNVRATCGGVYPLLRDNVDFFSASGSDIVTFNTHSFDLSTIYFDNEQPSSFTWRVPSLISPYRSASFNLEVSGSSCEFGFVENETFYFYGSLYDPENFNSQYFSLIGGTSYYSDSDGISLFPPSVDFDVVCDENYYGGYDDGNPFSRWPSPFWQMTEAEPKNAFKSKIYCQKNQPICNRPIIRENKNNFYIKGGICTLTYYGTSPTSSEIRLRAYSRDPNYSEEEWVLDGSIGCILPDGSEVGSINKYVKSFCGDSRTSTIDYVCEVEKINGTCPSGSEPRVQPGIRLGRNCQSGYNYD